MSQETLLLLLFLLLFPIYGPAAGLVIRMRAARALPKGRFFAAAEQFRRRRKIIVGDTIIFFWSAVIGGFEVLAALIYLGGPADLLLAVITYFTPYIVVFVIAGIFASLHAAIWGWRYLTHWTVAGKVEFMGHLVCTVGGYFLIALTALSLHVLWPLFVF